MNYFLKQPSSTVVGSLLKTKPSEAVYYYCRHCLRPHEVWKNHVREASSYVSALKAVPFANRKPSKTKGALKQKLNLKTEITKVHHPEKNSKSENKVSSRKEGIRTLGLKHRYCIDSTKSYDPSLLSCSLEVDKFYKNFGNNKTCLSSSKPLYTNAIKKLEGVPDNVSKPLVEGKDLVTSKSAVELDKIPLFKPLLVSVRKKPTQDTTEKFDQTKFTMCLQDFSELSYTPTYDHTIMKCLIASIDICTVNNKVLEGYNLFLTNRKKARWRAFLRYNNSDIVQLYNSLLYSLSVKGHWSLCKNVIHWMNTDCLRMNHSSYAALLLCLGRTSEIKSPVTAYGELLDVVNRIFNANISLNEVCTKSRLTKDELDVVLNKIREVIPEFDIIPTKTNLNSDCRLLKDLYLDQNTLSSRQKSIENACQEEYVNEQLRIEKKFFVTVKALSSGGEGNVHFKYVELYDALKKRWLESLRKGLEEVKLAEQTKYYNTPKWFNAHIFLNSIPEETLLNILMQTTLKLVECEGFSETLEQIAWTLGAQVHNSYQARRKVLDGSCDRTEDLIKDYVSWYWNPEGPAKNARQKWELLLQEEGNSTLDELSIKWPTDTMRKLGYSLLNIIMNKVTFSVATNTGEKEYPVLYSLMRYRHGVYRREIKCHPKISSTMAKVGFTELTFTADEVPMLCPPKPWKSVHQGGYLILPVKFVRSCKSPQGRVLRWGKIPNRQLYAVFDSLNTLQATPWMINEDVLDVASEVFKSGGSTELDVPLSPSRIDGEITRLKAVAAEENWEKKNRLKDINQKAKNDYGLWCETLYRLSLAEHFRKRVFWLPQNCDFRGRVYPIPALLNHIGSDLFRSLLVFAEGKPLGPKGLDWLKIHLINLTGSHKRRAVQDRLDYANEILPDIIDSAEKPLTGKKWWTKSEEPWQTLATCIEIRKVLSCPNPENYLCRLPIHQDGSCNGLQHYAALGKDVVGAKSVNLIPCDLPQDVYSVVAKLVENERKKDAEEGLEIAKILEGAIHRKVVKQTIMTTVYGVTLFGGIQQIRKRLEENTEFPQLHIHQASVYLTMKTFSCLRQMFTSARHIQQWLTSCAREICKNKNYVCWVSPLGLPILQPYGRLRSSSSGACEFRPDTVKQKNAFPPNFIHSLDSCHMMLTAMYCEKAGLTFAAVHDCFWTHPSSVDIMNKICREQFVSLHSEAILEDLSRFFNYSYQENYMSKFSNNGVDIFESLPEKGELDVKEVMKSVYFFS